MNYQPDWNKVLQMFAITMFAGIMSAPAAPLMLQNEDDKLRLAKARWKQIKSYYHTWQDIEKIASGQGIVHMYHGAPTDFAEMLVAEGPRVPYAVEDVARYVAKLYGLSWVEFSPIAYRKYEHVSKLSTAPAAIACRWAWSFPIGEVLSDLNSHARMHVAAKALSRSRGISYDDALDQLHEKAISISKIPDMPRYTTESAPGLLGLEDKIERKSRTGSLVQLDVDVRGLPHHIIHDAQVALRPEYVEEITKEEHLILWNNSYVDAKISAGTIKGSRIVIRDMMPWEQDVIEDMLREELRLEKSQQYTTQVDEDKILFQETTPRAVLNELLEVEKRHSYSPDERVQRAALRLGDVIGHYFDDPLVLARRPSGTVLGFASYYVLERYVAAERRKRKVMRLSSLGVFYPEKKIGKMLVRVMKNIAGKNNMYAVTLSAVPESMQFYRGLGFEKDERSIRGDMIHLVHPRGGIAVKEVDRKRRYDEFGSPG